MSRQLENSITSVAPTSILAVVENKTAIQNFVLEEQADLKFSNENELIYHITHKVNNVKHQDGRIYMKIDAKGKLFANSVSPYSEKFTENIETHIKPLVMAFHNKRYLTYSSCEGHDLTFRRYVGLAFADEETREYVAKKIMDLKLPGVFVKYFANVANQKIEQNKKGQPVFTNKFTEDEEVELKKLRERETHTFNIQFHRQYDQYYFLEIVILKEVKFDTLNPLKIGNMLWLAFLKKFYWDKITNKIVHLINSKEFKKYQY